MARFEAARLLANHVGNIFRVAASKGGTHASCTAKLLHVRNMLYGSLPYLQHARVGEYTCARGGANIQPQEVEGDEANKQNATQPRCVTP